jgi:hypothetical protein
MWTSIQDRVQVGGKLGNVFRILDIWAAVNSAAAGLIPNKIMD